MAYRMISYIRMTSYVPEFMPGSTSIAGVLKWLGSWLAVYLGVAIIVGSLFVAAALLGLPVTQEVSPQIPGSRQEGVPPGDNFVPKPEGVPEDNVRLIAIGEQLPGRVEASFQGSVQEVRASAAVGPGPDPWDDPKRYSVRYIMPTPIEEKAPPIVSGQANLSGQVKVSAQVILGAGIPTALYSIRDIVGARVSDASGRHFGTVSDVVVDSLGNANVLVSTTEANNVQYSFRRFSWRREQPDAPIAGVLEPHEPPGLDAFIRQWPHR